MKKAAIILPTYNEAPTIKEVIEKIFDLQSSLSKWQLDVIVVDSESPDNTASIVEKLIDQYPHLHLIKTKKEGLGKAYIEGFSVVIEKLDPYVLFEMDGDLSHNPDDIPKFLEKIEKGADFVIGSRYIKEGSIPTDWAFHRKAFSILGNWIIRLGFMQLRITDWTSGYRAIKTWIVKKVLPDISGYTGYVFQVALLDNAKKQHAVIQEVPINFIDRKEGESKINSFQYILHTLWYVFTNSSFIKFAFVGFAGFIIDFGISFIFIELSHTAIWIGTLVSTECAIISNFLLNNYWSFAHKRLTMKRLTMFWSFLKFNLISSGSILIQTLGVSGSSSIFGREYWYVYKVLIITFIIIPYSYVLYNKFIWKEK